ncbi:hypothetical protein Glove_478g13 [Diversispora epigaea]|uniref:Uncharacterized protein n=1 Tax=Diversispora epigaea TaxID=1348612 RepID=A0A397GPL5_9GLOM|nr:hypothetical protein Glove_478g13 [Diversispora epigaea]
MSEQKNNQNFKSFDSNEEDFDDTTHNSEDDGPLFKYNEELFELLMNANNNEDSGSDFSYFECNDEFDNENQLKINDKSEIMQDEPKIIPSETNTTLQKQTPCVIVDYLEGKIQTCGSTKNLRKLRNLIGSWEIDRDMVNNNNEDYLQLGVCESHFLYDQNQLHNNKDKQKKSPEASTIQRHCCIICKHYFTIYSRGKGCTNHSWVFNKCNLIVPCNECYQKNGEHVHIRHGRGRKPSNCLQNGLHEKDTSYGLEVIAEWLLHISKTTDENMKNSILTSIVDAIKNNIPFTFSENNNPSNINKEKKIKLSLFMVKMLFIDTIKQKKKKIQEEIENPENLGKLFGSKLWFSYNEIKDKKNYLEFPNTINEYYEGFPKFLILFLTGFITEIEEKKLLICNRQRRHHKEFPKTISSLKIIKIVTFLASIFINITFHSFNLWLLSVLASLGRKPRLISSLHNFLNTCYVIGHTERHERNKEKDQMSNIIPFERLKKDKNIWNLAIIDNIDFKTKSFSFGNIYDVTRETSHATLRIILKSNLSSNFESPELIEINEETCLFEMNLGTTKVLDTFQKIFEKILDFKIKENNLTYNQEFDAEQIKKIITSELEPGCYGSPPNLIILEPGNNPNSDDAILDTAMMYKLDLELGDNDFLDIVADQAIHFRLIRCQEQWPKLRPLLGVRFLDKLEANIDYRSISRVLDLLWVAIGTAINIYIKKKEISLESIMDNENQNIILKIWYLYFKWAGIWKAHKIGIRIGNHDLQRNCLASAAPLFASAGKNNYTTAIAHYLSTLAKYPKLDRTLHEIGAFKLPSDNNLTQDTPICFAFDEALETYGVHFIKQNITGNIINEETLKRNIKAAQCERERIDLLLSEYLEDTSISHSPRAINSRKEALWKLVNNLVMIFDMENPLEHPIFQEKVSPELNKEGLEKLIAYYPNSLDRIYKIYLQEVLKIEKRNPTGRRAIGVKRTKIQEYKEKKKAKNQKVTQINSSHLNSTEIKNLTEIQIQNSPLKK